jgi:hypothetical protein
MKKGGKMKVLKLAIKHERWDLAAHVIVLETALRLGKEGKQDGGKTQEEKRSTKGQH